MNSFVDIIDAWPSVPEFARDLGVELTHAHQMRNRNSIAPEWWPSLVERAAGRAIEGVTFDRLAKLRASRRTIEAAE